MRTADILRLALSALYQQKVRTLLTTLGVVIGTFVLIVSLSIGQGAQEATLREFRRYDHLRKVHVFTSFQARESDLPAEALKVEGAMSEAKRQRIRQMIVQRWNLKQSQTPPVVLNEKRMEQLRSLQHVETVVPGMVLDGRASLEKRNERVFITATAPTDRNFRKRMVAGEFPTARGGRWVIVSEYFLYQCGMVNDAEIQRSLGKKVRLEIRATPVPPGMLLFLFNAAPTNLKPEEEKILQKVLSNLPAAIEAMELDPEEKSILQQLLQKKRFPMQPSKEEAIVEEFTIVGVFRGPTQDERKTLWESPGSEVDMVLPIDTAEALYLRAPFRAQNGFHRAIVTVDNEDNVKQVARAIQDMGLEHYSLEDVLERVRVNVMLISFATAFIAAVALLIAALGITNTMLMSVLERTHEIGVMKAVGARNSHIQLMFLVEGALIGLIGSSVGLLLSWLVSIPADGWARSLVERQAETQLEESLFVFPLWLTLGVVILATVLTTMAAYFPARRAARINPIVALRHE